MERDTSIRQSSEAVGLTGLQPLLTMGLFVPGAEPGPRLQPGEGMQDLAHGSQRGNDNKYKHVGGGQEVGECKCDNSA